MKFKDLKPGDRFSSEDREGEYYMKIPGAYVATPETDALTFQNANVICIEGDNIGCLGVWQDTSEVHRIAFTGIHRLSEEEEK